MPVLAWGSLVRDIHLEQDLKLRFPGRPVEFDEGVEVGMVAALMALGGGPFSRRLSPSSLEQVRAVAGKLGYHIVATLGDDAAEVTFKPGSERPKLALVHSFPGAGRTPAAGSFGAPKRAELRAV
jgi:hypothetical protein